MGVIQSSINQALGAAEHGLTALAVKNVASGVNKINKKLFKDENKPLNDPEVKTINLSRKEEKQASRAMQEYSTNPALQQMMRGQTEYAVQNAI